uniref:Keratin n=1 Tax=Chelonoidis abingdonii TaxID=106734 RepID=A0A8C0H433_CHEAB
LSRYSLSCAIQNTGMAWPCLITGTCNQPCISQCPDSEVVIRPSLVVVTLPGSILSNFSQSSGVGAVGAPVVGPGFGGSFRALYGYGSHYGYGRLCGYGGRCGYLSGYGFGGLCGCGVSCHRYLSGNCGPC